MRSPVGKMLGAPALLLRSRVAASYGARRRIPGMEFDRFGRWVGWNLLIRGSRAGIGYLLTPVNIVRYFEFAFAKSALPRTSGAWLDVSSPRLFSLYTVQSGRRPPATILMINPDRKDVSDTNTVLALLPNLAAGLTARCCGVDSILNQPATYDCIWSISVVEHIHGTYDDTAAVRFMYDALKPGGRLILTVPVDRQLWDEYRDSNYYGTQQSVGADRYFFQRFYDESAIWDRLLRPMGVQPTVMQWFGETVPGTFRNYVQRWINQGYRCTVDDPREIADHYQEYSSWDMMPGVGVCGLVVEKSLEGAQTGWSPE